MLQEYERHGEPCTVMKKMKKITQNPIITLKKIFKTLSRMVLGRIFHMKEYPIKDGFRLHISHERMIDLYLMISIIGLCQINLKVLQTFFIRQLA